MVLFILLFSLYFIFANNIVNVQLVYNSNNLFTALEICENSFVVSQTILLAHLILILLRIPFFVQINILQAHSKDFIDLLIEVLVFFWVYWQKHDFPFLVFLQDVHWLDLNPLQMCSFLRLISIDSEQTENSQ